MKLFVSAALAAALSLGFVAATPAQADIGSRDKHMHRAEAKPSVKSRYGSEVKSRRVISQKTEKPVRLSSRFSQRKTSTAALKSSSAMTGTASYYRHGARTANGERFNPMGLTAAHRSLPFGTRVKVTHMGTGRSVVVRINDRGPFVHGRIIDLAQGAARQIGVNGLARVSLQVVN